MADRLVVETQDSRDRELLARALRDVSSGSSEAKPAEAPKPEKKAEKGGGLAGAKSAVQPVMAAIGSSVAEGGKRIADAIAPVNPAEGGIAARAGNAALGGLGIVSAPFAGLGAGVQKLVEMAMHHAQKDPDAPVQWGEFGDAVGKYARTALALPQILLDPKMRLSDPEQVQALAESLDKKWTWGEIANQGGQLAGMVAPFVKGASKAGPAKVAPKAAKAAEAESAFKAATAGGAEPKVEVPTNWSNLKAVEKYTEQMQARDAWRKANPRPAPAASAARPRTEAEIAFDEGRRVEEAPPAEAPVTSEPGADTPPGTIVAPEPAVAPTEAPVDAPPAPEAPVAFPEAPAEAVPPPAELQPVIPQPVEFTDPLAGMLAKTKPSPSEGSAAPMQPLQTVADLHEATKSVMDESAAADAQAVVDTHAAAHTEAQALAMQLREQGATREQIREAYRAKLNERGVLSKNQKLAAEGEKLAEAKTRDEIAAVKKKIATLEEQIAKADAQAPPPDADTMARTASAAAMDSPAEPEPAIAKALQALGVPKESAVNLATKVMDAYKASGFADERGSIQFWKNDETTVPYDRVAADPELAQHVASSGSADMLRRDLGKESLSDAQVSEAGVARERALETVKGVVGRIADAQPVQPGELLHAATVAGAVADKARAIETRFGPNARPGALNGGEAPIRTKDLLDFGERLHNRTTEMELYKKLSTMTDAQQQQWLGNLFRGRERLDGMYMTLYMNSMLSNPYTLAKATASHFTSLPLSVADRWMAEQWGKVMPGDKHVAPGEATFGAVAFWDEMKNQLSMIGNKDWDGIHAQMVAEGEYHPPIPMPDSPAGDMVNAIAGAPSYALGAQRAPFKVISRLGELKMQAFRQASREGLTGQEFWQQVEHYQKNPTSDMMKAADQFSDELTFTRNMDGIMKGLQGVTKGTVAKVLIDPFARVSLNIIDGTMQHTPGLNFLSDAWRSDWNAGGARRDLAMGKLSTGAAVVGTGYMLGLQGLVTGDGPRDPAAKKTWEAAGWRANTIYNPATGKPIMSHLALGPVSGLLAMGADAQFVLQHTDGRTGAGITASLALAMTEPLTHAGYLDVLSKTISAIREGVTSEAFWREIRSRIENLTLLKPGISRFAQELMEPGSKPATTVGRGDFVSQQTQKMIDDVTATWPGFAKNHPQQRAFLTDEAIPRDGFLPSLHQEVSSDPVAVEIDRLQQNYGEGRPYRVIEPPAYIGGKKPVTGVALEEKSPYDAVLLEAWEKDRLIQLMNKPVDGKTLHQALTELVTSADYKNMKNPDGKPSDGPFGGKALAIQTIYHARLAAAQQELLGEDKHLNWLVVQQKVDAANKLPGSVVQQNPLGGEPEPTKYPRPGQER